MHAKLLDILRTGFARPLPAIDDVIATCWWAHIRRDAVLCNHCIEITVVCSLPEANGGCEGLRMLPHLAAVPDVSHALLLTFCLGTSQGCGHESFHAALLRFSAHDTYALNQLRTPGTEAAAQILEEPGRPATSASTAVP